MIGFANEINNMCERKQSQGPDIFVHVKKRFVSTLGIKAGILVIFTIFCVGGEEKKMESEARQLGLQQLCYLS